MIRWPLRRRYVDAGLPVDVEKGRAAVSCSMPEQRFIRGKIVACDFNHGVDLPSILI